MQRFSSGEVVFQYIKSCIHTGQLGTLFPNVSVTVRE